MSNVYVISIQFDTDHVNPNTGHDVATCTAIAAVRGIAREEDPGEGRRYFASVSTYTKCRFASLADDSDGC